MASFFMFLGFIVILVVALNNRAVKSAFNGIESAVDTAGKVVTDNADGIRDLAQLGVSSARDAAMKAYFESLEERYHQGNSLDNANELEKDLIILHTIFNR